MKRIWLHWSEDITQVGHLRNLIVESALEEPSIRALDAMAKIAQQQSTSKNSTIRYMKAFFENKDDVSQKLTPKDLSEISTNLKRGVVDLQLYGNSELSHRDLRIFPNAVELGHESDSSAGDSTTSSSGELPNENVSDDVVGHSSSDSGSSTPTQQAPTPGYTNVDHRPGHVPLRIQFFPSR